MLHKLNFPFRMRAYRSLMLSFSIISENISMNDILLKTRFCGLHSLPTVWVDGSNFNRFDVVGGH